GLASASVDLITVAQALHWFDLEPFYTEVRRVLKPGGVFAAWCYGVLRVDGEAVNALAWDFYANQVGAYWPPERRLVENGYHDLPFPFQRIDPPEFAISVAWNLEQLLGYFGSWSATARLQKEQGVNPVERLAPDLRAVWGDPERPRRVIWSISMRVGRCGLL
ncbi:MAG: methyltransferase domain-containing protein, partial [Magnetococcales bacterium]|nr:methyltransferase domain-containing protein [Magnetococcales bacterium]